MVVCVLHKSNIEVRKCNIKKYTTFECLEITAKGKNEMLRISTIYRTGKMTAETRVMFLSEINEYCETLLIKKGKSVICGDFNIHVERKDAESVDSIDTMECNGYEQLVQGVTQLDGGTLDLIFMRKDDFDVDNVKPTLTIHDLSLSVGSDHSFIEFDIPFIISEHSKYVWIKYRKMKDFDTNDFKSALNLELNTRAIHDLNIDECLDHLNVSLSKIIDAKAPIINKKVVHRKNDFITVEITNLRRLRRKAERKYRKSKSVEDLKYLKT